MQIDSGVKLEGHHGCGAQIDFSQVSTLTPSQTGTAWQCVTALQGGVSRLRLSPPGRPRLSLGSDSYSAGRTSPGQGDKPGNEVAAARP